MISVLPVALITPAAWFVRISPLFPICPAPWIRLLTFINAPAFAWFMIGAPLPPFCIITVPPPVKVTTLSIRQHDVVVHLHKRNVPVLLIVPATSVVLLSSMCVRSHQR